jgi:hypothetical protein
MNEGEELIRQRAKRLIGLDVIYDDALAARCKVLETEAFDGLLSETRQRLSSGRLVLPAILPRQSFDIRTGY